MKIPRAGVVGVVLGLAIGYFLFGWPRTSGWLIIPGEE